MVMKKIDGLEIEPNFHIFFTKVAIGFLSLQSGGQHITYQ